jgi:hypothetical protein
VTAARPPGWYDEPSGDRALLRWWDGRSWTSVTRRRSPAEAPLVDDVPARPGPRDVLDSGSAWNGPSARRRWTLVAVVAGIAVLLFVFGLPNGGGDLGRVAEPAPTAPGDPGLGQPTFPRPAPSTARPVSGRIVDRVARLSYDVLPGAWREWDKDTFRGLASTLGYYRIVQDSLPNGDVYWANVTSGPVGPGTAAGDDLRGTAVRLVDLLARVYYPAHRREQVAQRALQVDGAPAYLLRYRAVFDPRSARGYEAKSEEVAVLVVDTGQDLPSALYVSLPDSVRSLWPSVDGLLSSVRVVR